MLSCFVYGYEEHVTELDCYGDIQIKVQTSDTNYSLVNCTIDDDMWNCPCPLNLDILIDSLEILMIKKDNADMWEQIIFQNKQCAEHNFRLFKNNSSQIIQKIDIDLDNWLEVYPEFVKIFKKG